MNRVWLALIIYTCKASPKAVCVEAEAQRFKSPSFFHKLQLDGPTRQTQYKT